MSRAARPVALLAALAVVAALLAAAAVGRPGGAEQPRRPALTVHGSVSGLYPGVRTTLGVVVRNRSGRPVRVRLVEARVRRPVRACPTTVLRIDAARPGRVLRPGARTVVRLPVRLHRAAPDACQGVTFPLSLRAVAGPR